MSKHPHGTTLSYTVGFVSSVALTLIAYVLVVNRSLTHRTLIATIAGLALVQFLVQIMLFLHLGTDTKPRWKLMVFLFMLGVVVILVWGSIWIMTNLNYHMLSPHEMNQYMKDQVGL